MKATEKYQVGGQMKKLAMLAAVCVPVFGFVHAAAAAAAAASVEARADDYRGGWEADAAVSGPHIYEFSIRGSQVRGIYCTVCNDATTLAFVDGTLGAGGLSFVVTHVRDDGSTAYQDHARAIFRDGRLVVTGRSGAPGGASFRWTMHKDPRGPAPIPGLAVSRLPPGPPVPPGPLPPGAAPAAAAGGTPRFTPPPYLQPGPWEQLSQAKLVGVWLGFGAGIDKQFFIFRRFGKRLRGMVCGRCDNPYTMAALDDFRIDGDTLHFNILHEDWGPGTLPFHNRVTAHLSQNELRITTQQDNMPPPPPGRRAFFGASLMGPVAIEATARH
jgi:hypothetical protein